MRIWIDVREACRARKTGKGQWTLHATEALLKREDLSLTLLTDAPIPAEWKTLVHEESVRRISSCGLLWHLRAWLEILRHRASIDYYISPTSYIVPFLIRKNVRVVPIIHDLIAFLKEPHDRKATFIERFTLPSVLKTAHVVCSVSEATAGALRRKFPAPKRIVIVHAGPTLDEKGTWNGRENHILCIATLCPRKNQSRLIDAFLSIPKESRRDVQLLLIGGRGWDDDEIVRKARDAKGITWMGFQPSEVCTDLLRSCKGCVFVSEEEGFGLPVLDAMRIGAPILASDIPSIREVAGDTVIYTDPRSVPSIRHGILQLIAHNQSAKQLESQRRCEQFTWEITAEKITAACTEY